MSVATRTRWALIVLLCWLAVCNVGFIGSAGWARLAWEVIGYAGLFVTYRVSKLTAADCGLQASRAVAGLRYGAAAVAAIGGGLLLLFAVNSSFFMDPRYDHSLPVALYAALVLLPLKTVLFEEFAFRGVMLGLAIKLTSRRWVAILVPSLAFGLWHVSSAAAIGSYRVSSSVALPQLPVILGTICVTTLAGAALCVLRLRSRSLVAPIMAHWALNGVAILLASLIWN